jgi:hypothetical protein
LASLVDHYSRLIAVAADWLNFRRIKIYTRSLPLIALAIALSTLFDDSSRSLFYDGDFILFYTGGRFFLDGRLDALYDFAAQEAFQLQTLKLSGAQFTPFNHPPHATLLYAPFAMAGFEAGLILWSLFGLAALALAWSVLRRELAPLATYSAAVLSLLTFCFYPTIAWFLANQNSSLSFLLLTIFYVNLRRGGDLTAGLALGCLIYKPQLLMVPIFILLLNGRWRALSGCFLTSALWIGIGFLISPNATFEYVRVLPQIAQLPFLPSYPIAKLHNIYGFCILLFAGFLPIGTVKLLAALFSLGGMVMLFFWWRSYSWQPGTRSWDLQMAATLALGLLLSPHLMFYDLMILLLPLTVVWSHYSKGVNGRALDGDRLLVWYALVYVGVFIGSYLSLAMLKVGPAFGLPRFAVQISVLIVMGWVLIVRRLSYAAR